jgi:hypothetical protein
MFCYHCDRKGKKILIKKDREETVDMFDVEDVCGAIDT